MSDQYEVLSPWADADPKPVNGITARVTDVKGKKIGLFSNYKRAAPLILNAVERKLREKFPEAEFSSFLFKQNADVSESGEKGNFEQWLKGVDTVVAAVGD